MKKLTLPTISIKKYGGKQVAIVKGKIVASGYSTHALIEKAKRSVPKKDHNRIALFVVPESLTVVYFL
jgi:hypothetical protein